MTDYITRISRSGQNNPFLTPDIDEKEELLEIKQYDTEKENIDRQILEQQALNKQIKEHIETIKEDIKKLNETCESYDFKKDDQEIEDLKREIEQLKEKDAFLTQELEKKEEILKQKHLEEERNQEETHELIRIIEEKKIKLQQLEEEVKMNNYFLEKDLETISIKEKEAKHLSEMLEAQEAVLKQQEAEYEQEMKIVRDKQNEMNQLAEEKELKLKELEALIDLERKERERYQEISRLLAQKEEETQIKKQTLRKKRPEVEDFVTKPETPTLEDIESEESPNEPYRSRNKRSFMSLSPSSDHVNDYESRKNYYKQKIRSAQSVKSEFELKQSEIIGNNISSKARAMNSQLRGFFVCLVGFLVGILAYKFYFRVL
ncbi:unnamed protein product [Blepharisma stoltei]|uniref:Uncharacterized protein n=1 Tax=Blepharisma stoltei TaxID=1481888 RepID=A0AAU9JBQ9_9CILI|nr:unnamed protein product [Blepharisma stoltei]